MGTSHVHIDYNVQATPTRVNENKDRLLEILVPVYSSGNVFGPLEYAVNFARKRRAGIHLLHITDLEPFAESDSPLIIDQIVKSLNRKAANCVESLTEIIQESGVHVLSTAAVTGQAKSVIQTHMKFKAPGMIVIGRDYLTKKELSHLISSVNCPLLIVPTSNSYQPPSSVLLIAERSISKDNALRYMSRILRGNVNYDNHPINFSWLSPKDPEITDTLTPYDTKDLVCVFEQEKSFLTRLLNHSFSDNLVHHHLPTLLIKLPSQVLARL